MSEDVKRFDGEILAFLMEQKNKLTELRPQILAENDADSIDEITGTLEEIKKAIMAISMAQFAREEGRTKFKKWEAILPACREASEKFEAISKEFERSKLRLIELRSYVDNAFNKLQQVRDQRLPDFPTKREIEEKHQREQKAEENYREHVARAKAGNEKMHALSSDQLQAKIALDQLLFQERQLRPRDSQPAGNEHLHLAGLAGVR